MSKYMLAALSLASFSSSAVVPGSTVNLPYIPPPAVEKQHGQPGFVSLPLHKKPVKAIGKRQSLDPLRNDISGYSVQITLGTPPQIQYVDLDTGSNELWVNPLCSTSYYPAGCIANRNYVPGSSSTSHNLGVAFQINYGIGSVAGTYYTDNITMGGASIRQQQFGDASTSQQMMQGILGIAWGNGVDTNYNNVIDNLKAQGITQSRAFGLNLASIDNPQGSIIFGGIDIMKYSGPLQKQPMIPRASAPDGYARYWFYMNQVSITPPGATAPIALTPTSYSQPMFPDSGSTFCQLPSALFTSLLAYFPVGQVNQGGNAYTVSCAYRTQAGYINFAFGGVTISVSYHEFIWFDGAQCWFAAQPSTQFYLLGDSFMRSAYIVYDQDNFNILIAPAANCGTSIVPISTGINAVPSINGACAPTYTPPVATTSTSVLKTSSTLITSTSNKVTTSSPTPTPSTTVFKPSLSSSSNKLTSTSSSSSPSSTKVSPSSSSSSSKISTSSTSLKTTSSSPQITSSNSKISSTSSSISKTSSNICSASTVTQLLSASTVTISSPFTVIQTQAIPLSITITQTQTQNVTTVFITQTSYSIVTADAPSVTPIMITSIATVTAAASTVAPVTVTRMCTLGVDCVVF